MKKILCGQFIVMLILFLWCTKAWAPFPMTHMESGEVKVDIPQREEITEEETAAPAQVEFYREEKKTQEPAADVSQPLSVEVKSETGGGFFTQEPQAGNKVSEIENKFIEKETPREETAETGKIKIASVGQLILDGIIIIFAVVILLTLIYLSRKGKR